MMKPAIGLLQTILLKFWNQRLQGRQIHDKGQRHGEQTCRMAKALYN